jgi:hypothetical protein
MVQIQPVIFPLNLGSANHLETGIISNDSDVRIVYQLFDTSTVVLKKLNSGYFSITQQEFINHGSDENWVLNYVIDKLGVTLI